MSVIGGYAVTTPLVGSGASISVVPMSVPMSTYAGTASPASALLSTSISSARGEALLQGAAPANQTEQAWVTGVENVLRTLITNITAAARGVEDNAFEQRVLVLVNQQRAANGLQPLAYDARLDLASERHNQVQAAANTMAHSGIGDGDPGSRIRATGFTGAWGENVATGQTTPEQVVAEWMASPGHRRNILDPSYRLLGVSYGTAADGRTYWAQSFGG